MREALATFPSLGSISKRFSQLRQNSKTVAVDSNSPPSSPVIRTVPIQTPKPHHHQDTSSSEAIPINFIYKIPEIVEKKDMNSLFDDYIRRARNKITTASNTGKGLGGTALADDKDHGTKKEDNQKEHFSNFIHRSQRKLRTTSGVKRER
ncbi:hypothetical protein K1719_009950 [Acacia pycnantha]|nr:hypothetical protein K1719_009950 [Acacia pycnantha]